MAAVPPSLIYMRRIIRTFYNQGATHPAAAIVPSRFGIRQSFTFQRLVQSGVLVLVSEDRYYLDVDTEIKLRRRRQRRVLIVMLVLLAIMVIGNFLYRR